MFIKVYNFLSFLPPQLSGEQQFGGSGVQLSASIAPPEHWAPPFNGDGEVHALLLDLDVAPQQLHAPQDDHPPSIRGAIKMTLKMVNHINNLVTKYCNNVQFLVL